MAIEIEHKYLIDLEKFKACVPERSTHMRQGYILNESENTLRVRVMGTEAFMTVKGKSTGASRLEFEYSIPVDDAEIILSTFTKNTIEKIRHYVTYDGHLWEVDEFLGDNAGLYVAEIELGSEDEQYSLPSWVKDNVTADKRYSNSNLALHPFSTF